MATPGRTERDTPSEVEWLRRLGALFDEWGGLPTHEKLASPQGFVRRQALSYVLADYEVFKLIANVKGSIIYGGTFHGMDMLTWANLSAALEPFNHTREVIGFDTWEGNTAPAPEDLTHGGEFHTCREGGWPAAPGILDCLHRMIALYDENRPLGRLPKIRLIQGDACQTVPEYMEKNRHVLCALLVLTMNLYEPTKKTIDAVWPRMPSGAVICIRSLNEDYYPGATRAVIDGIGVQPWRTFPFAPNLAYAVKA